jgi:hypothetical protein
MMKYCGVVQEVWGFQLLAWPRVSPDFDGGYRFSVVSLFGTLAVVSFEL